MLKKNRVSIPHIILYVMFLFAYYTFTKDFSQSFVYGVFSPLLNTEFPRAVLFVLTFLSFMIIDLLLPVLVTGVLFFFFVPEHYHKKSHWHKCFLKFVLPGEILRFIISLVCLGHNNQIGGRFSHASTFLFENTYMYAANRYEAIRHDLEYIPTDFLVFALWYLVYAAVYGVLIARVYRMLWMREKSIQGDDRVLHPQNAPTDGASDHDA